MKIAPYKHRKTGQDTIRTSINQKERTDLTLFLHKHKEEFEKLTYQEVRKRVVAAFGWDEHFSIQVLQRICWSLGYPTRTSPKQTAHTIKVHLDDWEHRLKALEERVKLLEDLMR